MRVIITVILAVFLFTLTAYSQLTDDAPAKIPPIVKVENSKIKAEMTAIELRLTQKIQESENRLRSELNEQLNARIHDFTIVFGIISGGFFLLFAAVLLINALKGRTILDKGTNTILAIAAITGILNLTGTAIAYEENKEFGKILCKELIIKDKNNNPRIVLTHDNTIGESMITLYGGKRGAPTSMIGLVAGDNKYNLAFTQQSKDYGAHISGDSESSRLILLTGKPRKVMGFGYKKKAAQWFQSTPNGKLVTPWE